LDDRLQQLQATVTALVERTSGSAGAVPAEDADVVAASRTLKMAEQTAQATITEAKDEATKLLAGAREQSDSMLVAARQAAEAEHATQRETMATETAAWEARKRELTDLFATIETQLTECDGRLADAHLLIRTALDHPAMVSTAEPTAAVAPAPPVADPSSVTPPAVDAEPVPADVPDEPAAEETAAEETAPKETVFGNPPAPVFSGPAKDDAGTQAFYPWSGNSAPAGTEGEAPDAPSEPPAPPVQRRGLFGH
jgi:vacuolar-type H+-ATPase subunit H